MMHIIYSIIYVVIRSKIFSTSNVEKRNCNISKLADYGMESLCKAITLNSLLVIGKFQDFF